MMSANSLFEEFGRRQSELDDTNQVDEGLEDAKLQSFEQGYGAGWDDAIEAQKKAGRLLSESVQTSMRETAVTKEAAMLEFSEAILPVFEAMLSSVLPELANRAFPDQIKLQIEKILQKSGDLPIEVRTASDQLNPIKAALEHLSDVDISVREDSDLAPGQALLAFGASEIRTDIPALMDELNAIVETFYFSLREEQ